MSIRQDKYGMTIRLHDKLKALETYAKMAGWLTDKQEITATVTYEQFLSKLDGDYNYD
jgi:2-oxo-4-hydroxy-4-carboxy--5-ureidoimidazoline (OHCU) decarboxylase